MSAGHIWAPYAHLVTQENRLAQVSHGWNETEDNLHQKHKWEQEGKGGTLWYGVVALRAQRSALCGCDSASVPRMRERARELNEVTQFCLTGFFLECLPFSSRRKIKLPAVKVRVERQASLLSARPCWTLLSRMARAAQTHDGAQRRTADVFGLTPSSWDGVPGPV